MERIAALIVVLFLAGCTTVPKVPKFPTPPDVLMQPVEPLQLLQSSHNEK